METKAGEYKLEASGRQALSLSLSTELNMEERVVFG